MKKILYYYLYYTPKDLKKSNTNPTIDIERKAALGFLIVFAIDIINKKEKSKTSLFYLSKLLLPQPEEQPS